MILAVLVRQNYVVLMLFVFALGYLERYGYELSSRSVWQHLRRGWVFLVGFAAFVAFVAVNRGVAVGDRQMHTPFRLYLGNLYFSLFLGGMILLPLHVAHLSRIALLVRNQPWIVVLVVAIAGLYAATFEVTHPYNLNMSLSFVHNHVLAWATASPLHKAIFFLPMTWAILSFAVTPLARPSFYLLYPTWVLLVTPHWMIEQRYALPCLVLFLLLRRRETWFTETLLLIWFLMLSTWSMAITSGLLYVGGDRGFL
jgi:hypothetical protein